MEDSEYTYGVGARNCDGEQEEITSNLVVETESKPAEWTDEKHSLYLKSMEATFVSQLYKSLNLLSGSKSSKHKLTSSSGPSSQFKVLRDGCWSKIDFSGGRDKINQEKPDVLFANPWMQHYRSSERQTIRKVRAKDPLATNVNQKSTRNFHLWNRDSSKKEMSDQNFNDEDLEEEKCDETHEMKRTRTSTDIEY